MLLLLERLGVYLSQLGRRLKLLEPEGKPVTVGMMLPGPGCQTACNIDPLWSGPLGPDSGQAAGLTMVRAWCSSNMAGLR